MKEEESEGLKAVRCPPHSRTTPATPAGGDRHPGKALAHSQRCPEVRSRTVEWVLMKRGRVLRYMSKVCFFLLEKVVLLDAIHAQSGTIIPIKFRDCFELSEQMIKMIVLVTSVKPVSLTKKLANRRCLRFSANPSYGCVWPRTHKITQPQSPAQDMSNFVFAQDVVYFS